MKFEETVTYVNKTHYEEEPAFFQRCGLRVFLQSLHIHPCTNFNQN